MAFVSTRRQFSFKGLPLDAQNRILVARERVRRRFREQIPQARGRIPRARSEEVPRRGEGRAEDTRRVTWVVGVSRGHAGDAPRCVRAGTTTAKDDGVIKKKKKHLPPDKDEEHRVAGLTRNTDWGEQ